MMGVTSQTTIINRCNYLSLTSTQTDRSFKLFNIVVRRKTAQKLEEKKNRRFTICKTRLPYHSQILKHWMPTWRRMSFSLLLELLSHPQRVEELLQMVECRMNHHQCHLK